MMIERSAERKQNWSRDFIYEQAALVGVSMRNAEHLERN